MIIQNNLGWSHYPEAVAAAEGTAADESAPLREMFATELANSSAVLVFFPKGLPAELAAPLCLAHAGKFAVLNSCELMCQTKKNHLARVYTAWCDSSAGESTAYHDFLEELLTTEQAEALAVAAEERAAANPARYGSEE